MSEYCVGELVRSIATGCGHRGIFEIVKKVAPGQEPDFMEGATTPVYICRRVVNDGSEEGCDKASPIGAIRYLCGSELQSIAK